MKSIKKKLEELTARVGRNADAANTNRRLHRRRIDKLEAEVYSLEYTVSALARAVSAQPKKQRVGEWCDDPICRFSQHGTRWICNCTTRWSHRPDSRKHHLAEDKKCNVCSTQRPEPQQKPIKFGKWAFNAWTCSCSNNSYCHASSDSECTRCGNVRPGVWF